MNSIGGRLMALQMRNVFDFAIEGGKVIAACATPSVTELASVAKARIEQRIGFMMDLLQST
ncbi:MAG: hypothetical protein ACP5M1_02975 [Acidiphilium sp.]